MKQINLNNINSVNFNAPIIGSIREVGGGKAFFLRADFESTEFVHYALNELALGNCYRSDILNLKEYVFKSIKNKVHRYYEFDNFEDLFLWLSKK